MTTTPATTPLPTDRPDGPRQPRPGRHYWERLTKESGGWATATPPGQDLSAMRRGFGVAAGTVPGMWPFYTTLDREGRLTHALRAEHVTLSLYGLHQQGQSTPMHREGVGVGRAIRALRASGRYSEAAVDARFTAAATATDIDELGFHLRGLINQLRTLKPAQPLDYTALYADLRAWQHPDSVGRVRRRWGSDYFRIPTNTATGEADPFLAQRKDLL